jgi:hypothetical protein
LIEKERQALSDLLQQKQAAEKSFNKAEVDAVKSRGLRYRVSCRIGSRVYPQPYQLYTARRDVICLSQCNLLGSSLAKSVTTKSSILKERDRDRPIPHSDRSIRSGRCIDRRVKVAEKPPASL